MGQVVCLFRRTDIDMDQLKITMEKFSQQEEERKRLCKEIRLGVSNGDTAQSDLKGINPDMSPDSVYDEIESNNLPIFKKMFPCIVKLPNLIYQWKRYEWHCNNVIPIKVVEEIKFAYGLQIFSRLYILIQFLNGRINQGGNHQYDESAKVLIGEYGGKHYLIASWGDEDYLNKVNAAAREAEEKEKQAKEVSKPKQDWVFISVWFIILTFVFGTAVFSYVPSMFAQNKSTPQTTQVKNQESVPLLGVSFAIDNFVKDFPEFSNSISSVQITNYGYEISLIDGSRYEYNRIHYSAVNSKLWELVKKTEQ